jgi:hypothetical protein
MRRRLCSLLSIIALLSSCGGKASVEPLSAEATAVTVRKGDAPPGSQEVGTIEGEHGSGCGAFGEKGTYEGAMNALREKAVSLGADYVALISVTEPHRSGECFDQRFTLRGLAYKVANEQPHGIDDTASSSTPAAAQPEGCDPPCSPGYRCSDQVCHPQCNPPCSGGQVCRSDRTCGPPASK